MEKTSMRVLMCVFLAVGWLVSCSSEKGVGEQQAVESTAPTAEEDESVGTPVASVETDKGIIVVELLPEVAPATVERFIELAEVGFYRRTSFHRVMKDRMIQGGDPLSRDNDPFNDGQGTSGEYLPQEFSSVPFERGTVAMGRLPGGDNGGSCQFFITLKPAPEWEGQYNVFGKVIEGIEVAEEISRSPLSKSDQPSMKNRPAGKQIIKRISVEYR
jgi:cyclophilin family peptidyl-prolyl cis-trans isomerase